MLSPDMVQELYARRDGEFDALATKGTINPSDLLRIDRLGRFRVACELWGKCSCDARAALFNDNHPYVRSAALIASQSEPKTAPIHTRSKSASMGM